MEALTTRRLAKRLGVEGPSLYNHVAGRDDLLDEMTAVINEQIDASGLDHPDWRVGLANYARSYRRAFSVRPQLVATIASRPVRSRVALLAYDETFAAFEQLGWDQRTAAAVLAALDFLVLGSCIETFGAGFDRPPDEYEPEYPHLAGRAAGDRRRRDGRSRFRARARGCDRVHQRPRGLRPCFVRARTKTLKSVALEN